MSPNNEFMHTESTEKISHDCGKTVIHLDINCRIEKFKLLIHPHSWHADLRSKDISSKFASGAIWTLQVLPGKVPTGFTSVRLHLSGSMVAGNSWYKQAKDVKASYQIYLVGGTDGEIDSIRSGTSEDFDYQLPHQDSFSVCECIVGHGRMRKALQAYGSLVVSAKIAFFAPSETALHGYDDPQRWMAKFSKLCGEDASADCWIHIGGETLPAHKFPLMAQSPVFHAMFSGQMESAESESGIVKIPGFESAEPMRAILSYCYQGRLEAETMGGEWSAQIFELADKYSIDDLKALLAKHYVETLSAENVITVAEIADMHSVEKLKEECIKLIAVEREAVFNE